MNNTQVAPAAAVSPTRLGFWIYLMTDLIVFASLFATYVILRHGTNGGPGGSDIFDLSFVLVETGILLASSLTCGLAHAALRYRKLGQFWVFLITTLLLGAAFLGMELNEFAHLVSAGHSWQQSAFLSAFFTLVGTHGFHILIGLLWCSVLGITIRRRGVSEVLERKVGLFSMFWHFLDIVWIFIFTVVYVMGVTS